jgi:Cu(I)/Ag(I) efflux system membrane fusion protein
MAFENKGARWLQQDEEVRNPYFGAAMFRCGEVEKQIKPVHNHQDPHHTS